MNINLQEICFSVYGSYFAIGHLHKEKKVKDLYMRSVHGTEPGRSLFQITLWRDGKELEYTEKVQAGLLELEADNAKVWITFQNENAVRMRAENCDVKLWMERPNSGFYVAYPIGEGHYEFNSTMNKQMFTQLRGTWEDLSSWYISRNAEIGLLVHPDSDGVSEFIIEEFNNIWKECEYDGTVEEKAAYWAEHFAKFLDTMPAVPEKYEASREIASYINWAGVVHPEGHLKRYQMLMSKNWMNRVWSWDHCFNAMALAEKNPAAAWDQYIGIFDLQDEFGALPDAINDTVWVTNFLKPPIHGLVLDWMEKRGDVLAGERLAEAYDKLSKWTNFWLVYRDEDNDGIPEYRHGNDSGWDNSTVFKDTPVVEGTDLCGFLVLQMEKLVDLANRLGLAEDAEKWNARKEQMINDMVAHFWKDGKFHSCISRSHVVSSTSSLLNFMVLVMGERLPEEIREQLLKELLVEGSYETSWGFATEMTESEYYQDDGYWRGPIWAPSTWLLIQGLKTCGKEKEAREATEKFCELCDKNGFAENFDAISGEGLRDRAYTWTSSVFLILANTLL